MRVYKALGFLISYPTAELQQATDELHDAVASAPLGSARKDALLALLVQVGETPLLDLQEQYVNLFDRTRALSLHLFEHVHGSGKDRGQAMVQLQTMYSQHGLEPSTSELPDYLPMVCEFLSLLPAEGARTMLGDLAVILGLLAFRLEERHSAYAAVPAALLELAKAPVDEAELREVVRNEPPEGNSMDELDRQWAETEVTFGVGDAHSAGVGGGAHSGCNGEASQDLVPLRRSRA